jgi:hypothetical protein
MNNELTNVTKEFKIPDYFILDKNIDKCKRYNYIIDKSNFLPPTRDSIMLSFLYHILSEYEPDYIYLKLNNIDTSTTFYHENIINSLLVSKNSNNISIAKYIKDMLNYLESNIITNFQNIIINCEIFKIDGGYVFEYGCNDFRQLKYRIFTDNTSKDDPDFIKYMRNQKLNELYE